LLVLVLVLVLLLLLLMLLLMMLLIVVLMVLMLVLRVLVMVLASGWLRRARSWTGHHEINSFTNAHAHTSSHVHSGLLRRV
jgi:hypothetical protein